MEDHLNRGPVFYFRAEKQAPKFMSTLSPGASASLCDAPSQQNDSFGFSRI